MARLFATMIEEGRYKLEDVKPASMQAKVRQILIDDGYLDA